MVARSRRGGGSRVKRTRDDHLGAQPDRERASSPQNHMRFAELCMLLALAATATRKRARTRALP